MLRTSLTRFTAQIVLNARESAERLLHASAPIYAPDVLSRVRFEPSKIYHESRSVLVFPLVAGKEAANAFRSLHGGALASLADMFTTLHLWGEDPQSRHVSVSFDIQYLAAAMVGKEFECLTKIVKKGKRLAFTEFEFRDRQTKEVVCKGTHTKAFI